MADETRSEDGAEAEVAERPRKKKRRKRKKPAEPLRSKLDARGVERPAFLLDFPKDPELERLIAQFEAGDYAGVRAGASQLAERSDSSAIREAALELSRRTEPDPLIKYLLLASVALLLFLTLHSYLGH